MQIFQAYVRCLVVLVVSGALGDSAWGQTAEDTNDPHAADRAALQQIKERYTQAVEKGELESLESKLAKGFSAVMVTGHETESFDELRDYWDYIRGLIGEDGTYSLEVLPEPAKFSGDYALSQGTTNEEVVAGGSTYSFETLWSAVFVKQSGEWRLLRLHASMDPINNTFVATARTQSIVWSLAIGGVAGVLLGVGGVLLIKRGGKKPEVD
ncbi:MAG: nuclear transport factor 2 family protein [Planctomycetota bacterium]